MTQAQEQIKFDYWNEVAKMQQKISNHGLCDASLVEMTEMAQIKPHSQPEQQSLFIDGSVYFESFHLNGINIQRWYAGSKLQSETIKANGYMMVRGLHKNGRFAGVRYYKGDYEYELATKFEHAGCGPVIICQNPKQECMSKIYANTLQTVH